MHVSANTIRLVAMVTKAQGREDGGFSAVDQSPEAAGPPGQRDDFRAR